MLVVLGWCLNNEDDKDNNYYCDVFALFNNMRKFSSLRPKLTWMKMTKTYPDADESLCIAWEKYVNQCCVKISNQTNFVKTNI